MKLAILSSEFNVPNETATVNELFGKGLDLFHIRKPSFTETDYRNFIENIETRYHEKIVIHGGYKLFNEYKLAGIHLNSHKRNEPAIWKDIIDIPPSSVSTSFHSWDEILQNNFCYGSVFISPVFDSITKPGYKGAINIAAIAETREVLNFQQKYCPQIFGLGGVDKEGIGQLQKAGYDGAALLGAIWNTDDPVSAFCDVSAAIKRGA